MEVMSVRLSPGIVSLQLRTRDFTELEAPHRVVTKLRCDSPLTRLRTAALAGDESRPVPSLCLSARDRTHREAQLKQTRICYQINLPANYFALPASCVSVFRQLYSLSWTLSYASPIHCCTEILKIHFNIVSKAIPVTGRGGL
jgi:hypothetical protein